MSSDIKLETEGDVIDDLEDPDSYRPKDALHKAIKDWMLEFKKDCSAPSRKVAALSSPTIVPPSSPIPAPLIPPVGALPGVSTPEVNESYMQPKTVVPVNSLVDAPSDSDLDSAVELAEPMDYVPTSSEKTVSAGYDSGCGDCDIPAKERSENETMQVDIDSVLPLTSSDKLLSLIPECSSCEDSMVLHAGKVCCKDVQLLVDLFYMPFEHGPQSSDLLNEFMWLKVNYGNVTCTQSKSSSEEQKLKHQQWIERAQAFREQLQLILSTLDKFLDVPNKAILYDLQHYIWDMKTILTVVDAFIAWLGKIKMLTN